MGGKWVHVTLQDSTRQLFAVMGQFCILTAGYMNPCM